MLNNNGLIDEQKPTDGPYRDMVSNCDSWHAHLALDQSRDLPRPTDGLYKGMVSDCDCGNVHLASDQRFAETHR